MISELLKIVDFIWKSVIHVWPYLLITIPIAVAVNMSGASKYIGKAFNKNPMASIFLATVVGAFSPFCSCSVIPIIASLLIGGVPLAPVMSFWLASPSMDPEIFFLSVSILGWKLAVWRLSSAFMMSLAAGIITQLLVKKGWITAEDTLRANVYSQTKKYLPTYNEIFKSVREKYLIMSNKFLNLSKNKNEAVSDCGCSNAPTIALINNDINEYKVGCCDDFRQVRKFENVSAISEDCGCSDNLNNSMNESVQKESITGNKSIFIIKEMDKTQTFPDRLMKEIIKATTMVVKFMLLAYFLEALIILYVPSNFIQSLLGANNFLSIIWAALIGIPVYTSSMPALALVGGLISQGMAPAAGLAFLISGPTTTIPAMAAVWNLANNKVFFLYVGFTLAGAVVSGLLYYITSWLFV